MKKDGSNKILFGARHFNSNTDKSSETWPLQLLAKQPARSKNYKSATDPLNAYAHATVVDEPIELPVFSSGHKLLAFIRGFYGLNGLPNFFTQKMSLSSLDLIPHGSALVFIDEISTFVNLQTIYVANNHTTSKYCL